MIVDGLVEARPPCRATSTSDRGRAAYKPFYMHRTSHWLGMDVHDVGAYYRGGKPRPLEPGMVLTVEPGIYIAADNDKVRREWRGIGVRIEDDILVTPDGDPTISRRTSRRR